MQVIGAGGRPFYRRSHEVGAQRGASGRHSPPGASSSFSVARHSLDGASVVILSRDGDLVRALRRAAPRAHIVSRKCLAAVGRVGGNTRLIVDPRSADARCLQRLARWRGRCGVAGVVYLSLPASPDVLLRLPQICPGAVSSIANLVSLLKASRAVSPARSAWGRRSRILAPVGRPAKARQFLELARTRDHDGCTLEEASAAIHLNARALNRLCRRWFGCPPGLMLDLARIVGIARELRETRTALGSLAAAYDYPDPPALSNQFLRFVGLRPGAYRARFAHH